MFGVKPNERDKLHDKMVLVIHLHIWGGHMSQAFICVPVVLKTPAEEQQINHKISFI